MKEELAGKIINQKANKNRYKIIKKDTQNGLFNQLRDGVIIALVCLTNEKRSTSNGHSV
jgi:hypothetical protein